ncbi:hypothetical protein [Amycolatopsis sp. NPDC059021]|uniref:hypothetical protein n=1 Tax=Amycolatopsis sp. NPDC059021 TaxID=3346704 RepID=UPI00366DE4BB
MSTATDITTETANNTASAVTSLVGDDYHDTAELSLDEIAARVHTDLRDVQGDGMIPADAAWAVTADETGPQNLIRITVAGLHRTNDNGTIDPSARTATRKAVKVAFGLASNYNRFELQPYRLRFLTVIGAVTDDGAGYGTYVGAMVQDL